MTDTFKDDLMSQYQGEIIGESFSSRMLELYPDPEQQYKIGLILQLETETKARLRPAMVALGMDIRELDESRAAGLEMAAGFEGKSWHEAMTLLRDLLVPYVERYTAIAQTAPSVDRELAEAMVTHEAALHRFAELEVAGETQHSTADMVAQLQYPLPGP